MIPASHRSNPFKGQSRGKNSLIAGMSKLKKADLEKKDWICFNFKHVDLNQGQTVKEWENLGLLAKTFDHFRVYSGKRFGEAINDRRIFKIYEAIPKDSEFKHPAHVPEDARWACLHTQGKECVIGHVVSPNIFYVVFFDKDHKFYPVPLKHT